MSGQAPLALLYVDDDADIRHIVKLAVSLDRAMDLRAAGSAAEALALLDASDWRPDVIMLDVMMPKMSGPELMGTLRHDYGLHGKPFIFITAMGREMDLASYRKLGVADIILKPFNPITLAQHIRKVVNI
ncbi:CheY-like chemotaxis protein [Sphingobium sp. B2D3A]|uniref:response regulator n=1 Tax=unclassified Sphingobium TaxID=2611147 RepID=UPI0022252DDA|nr:MULTISPECIES: response regulator [unclassified Sphingobium]MCW2339143.1 CheY-like chemotaxis protein [Sphingobium sp. B2D3A]MCW2370770.1 CheY-like chemotaxis protein [Sphingobium sp. B11D3D]MCW2386913.1 CheY-like chemotaxis protein [Sphingobium sp. B2D3D]MCW2413488.1 CheY-like chemotaxis protein [Sphingobium sp. B8D3D]MCW2414212.1 CheY-like chemotaxis protein [Sphingobium sp. B8D3A]